ncbi:hypothetical protein KKC16_02180 [Patescibacteria group bacterium]|nr:hypothetical protein [Patescibacteria group bacterium]MBU4482236.1 hypothetical protein [Patescibacteria group bacterium]
MRKIRMPDSTERIRLLRQAGRYDTEQVYSTDNQSSNAIKKEHDKNAGHLYEFDNERKKQDIFSEHEKRQGGKIAKKETH